METNELKQKYQFPSTLLMLSVGLTLVMFFILILLNLWMMQSFEKTYNDNKNIVILRGEIMRLDEVLTMSAWMAATTGNSKWEHRYLKNEPLLDAYIKTVVAILPTEEQKQLAKQTDVANIALVEMEHKALALTQKKQLDQARIILESTEYQEQKQIYAAGMGALSNLLDKKLESIFIGEHKKLIFAIILTVIIVLLLLAIWLRSYKQLTYWRTQLEETNRNLESLIHNSQKGMVEHAKGPVVNGETKY